jgi:hypothetical protein
MSISQNFPNTRPSLNLNFARSKTLDPRISFIRIQTGNEAASYVDESGIIRYTSADEPRFDHDPETGECLGLIIEEQRENLFRYNTKHDEVWWINQSSSETINTTETLSPDGTNNATKLFGNNGATERQSIYQSISVTSGVTYTFSVFLKQGERRYATMWFDSPNVSEGAFWGASSIIDLQTGTLATGSQTKIIPYPNGWYRCYVTATPTATQTMNMNLSVGGPNNNNGAPYDATGDGSSGIYIWGHQLEADKDYSSYIPTSGSTVTRNSDNVWMDDITDFFNPNEGTAIITYRPRFDGVYNTPFRPLFSIRNTTTGRSIGFDGNSNTGQLFFTDYNNILQDDGGRFTWLDPPTPSTQRSERVLVSYANTYFRMYQNEIAFVSTNTLYGRGKISEYIPSAVGISTLGFNAIIFGSGATGNNTTKFNYTLQQFIYYPSEVGVSNARTLSKRP